MTEAATSRGGFRSLKSSDLKVAVTAWRVSGSYCTTDCQPYHKIRPLLRCLGLSAEPTDQAEFFKTSISEAIRNGARDILICGTSDTAMPELVLAIADAVSVPVRLHLLDICQTPGQLARQCIEPAPSTLETEASDILHWSPSQRFDVIVTHSLLGQFSPQARPDLFKKWHQLLHHGGRVITVTRIRPQSEVRTYKVGVAEALADEVVGRYQAGETSSEIAPRDLHDAVVAYGGSRKSHAVNSSESIVELCAGADLEILSLRTEKCKTRSAGLSGPALPDGGTYCHLVARKPIA